MSIRITNMSAGCTRSAARSFPGSVCTIRDVGLAMINAAPRGAPKAILEVKDIVALAK